MGTRSPTPLLSSIYSTSAMRRSSARDASQRSHSSFAHATSPPRLSARSRRLAALSSLSHRYHHHTYMALHEEGGTWTSTKWHGCLVRSASSPFSVVAEDDL